MFTTFFSTQKINKTSALMFSKNLRSKKERACSKHKFPEELQKQNHSFDTKILYFITQAFLTERFRIYFIHHSRVFYTRKKLQNLSYFLCFLPPKMKLYELISVRIIREGLWLGVEAEIFSNFLFFAVFMVQLMPQSVLNF